MTMNRIVSVMMLALLACGQGADTSAPRPPEPDSKPALSKKGELKDYFVWGDASQPAHDWEVDSEACRGRVDEDPSIGARANELVKVAAFIDCMEEMGWASKEKAR